MVSNVGNSEPNSCLLCRENMHKGAIFCANCMSFQDWRRHFKISNLVISLLVALLAVATTAIDRFSAIWPKKDSNIIASQPVFYGKDAFIIFNNIGDLSGSLEDGFLESKFIKQNIKLDPKVPNERLINSGTSQIALSAALEMTPSEAKEAMNFINYETKSDPSLGSEGSAGKIFLNIRNSNGVTETKIISVSRYELFKLLNAYGEDCYRANIKTKLSVDCIYLNSEKQEKISDELEAESPE